MSDTNDTMLDAIRRRSAQRRDVLKYAGQATAVVGGLTLLSACGDDTTRDLIPPTPPYSPPASPTPSASPTSTPTPAPSSTVAPGISAADIPAVNFLLNLAYLQAAFYLDLGSTTTLSSDDIGGGDGTGGGPITVQGKAVALTAKDTTSFAQSFSIEIGRTSLARLRKIKAVLGTAAIPAPAIDTTNPTTWKIIGAGSGQTIANTTPNNNGPAFIAATIFMNSLVLAAFRGALDTAGGTKAALVTSKAGIDLVAGCIAGLSYHSAQLRMLTDMQSQLAVSPNNGANNGQIKDTRGYTAFMNSLIGAGTKDQSVYIGDGAVNGGGNTALAANVTAADTNGLAIARTPQRTLSIVYLNATAGTTSGGFFPSGVNGTITVSADA